LTIRIEITAETPEQYRAYLMALTGVPRIVASETASDDMAPGAWNYAGVRADIRVSPEYAEANSGVIDVAIASGDLKAAPHPDEGGPATPVEPAPQQRKRRTKAEIEAARAAEAPPPLASQTITRAISETPEERVGPTDAPEIEDEPKPEQPADAPLTHDNVRSALKAVVDAKGLPFATSLLTKLGFGKVSDIPADKFGEVIEQLKGAAA
jgi:hypothetical protein